MLPFEVLVLLHEKLIHGIIDEFLPTYWEGGLERIEYWMDNLIHRHVSSDERGRTVITMTMKNGDDDDFGIFSLEEDALLIASVARYTFNKSRSKPIIN